ncbi:HNH endonuclease family protein [Embleya sp. NPDC005575]|uniref:HNH endonuclease family protein n=1 Tax=Embleya sp. NPDC005575 TaxID=3156892 RepID=UPI0033A50AC8
MGITTGRRTASLLVAATSLGALLFAPATNAAAVEPTQATVATETGTRIPLRDAIAGLRVAEENRAGYDRDAFRHWVDADKDGCSTRAEVLIEEAVTPPEIGAKCALTGGRWYSYYEDAYVDGASGLDIDHMVPLAEAWDSGASAWTPQQREQYANDLDQPRALVAVTAKYNRSKADQDPGTWLPPYEGARCTYLTDWVTVKTKYDLTVDTTELATLERLGAQCPNVPISPGTR